MLAAMNAVKHGEMGLNEAAIAHGIPKTTLKDRISGRVTHGINPGPRQYLDKNEEKLLCCHRIWKDEEGSYVYCSVNCNGEGCS